MSDELQLGLGIQFDQSTLRQLNSILTYVQKLQKQFDSLGDPLQKIKQPTVDMNAEFNKLNVKAKEVTKTVNNFGKGITQSFQQANGQIVQVTRNADGTITRLKTINKSTDSITSSIGNAASKMFLWSSAGFLLFNTIRGIQDGFKTLVSVESEIVNIRKVLPDDADFAPFAKGAQIISQQFGVSLTSTLQAMQSWSRQVKDTNSIMQLTNSSMLAAAVTDITLESSYKALSSIIKQFSMDVSESSHVIDTFNELSNNMRVTAEDLAQGLAKTGSAAKLMGVDFDRAAGLVGTLTEITSMSGSQAGTVLSRMFSRIHTDGAVNALKKINMDAFQPMSKTLDELGLRWNNLTKSQQENIAKSLGGMHHYQKLLALFSNYNRVIEATIMSYDSMGSAEKEMQLAMSTYQKKLEQLKAAFQSLAVNMGNNMLPIFKNIIDGFRILITYHDGIIPKLALVAAGVWGLVAAFKALAAIQTITLTGWLGIGAILVTGAAYLVGMSNSSKQATDSLTQLNNSMNVVNTSMTNLSKASERVRQIEYLSNVHEKLHTKLQTVDKSTKDYVDTLNLYKKVQNQINDLGNKYGVKLDKGKSKYEAERDQVNELITKLKELETQKQRMYEKDLQRQIKQKQQFIQAINQQTFGNSGPNFFDLKRYYYQAWQKMDKEQIQRGREMTERWIRFNPNFSSDQINQHISDFRKDPTGWFKSMTAAFNQAEKDLVDLELERTKNALKGVELKDWTEEPSDKIKTILSTLTESEVNMIKTVSNALNDLLPAGKKFDIDTQRIFTEGNFKNFVDVKMPSEISDKLMSEFNSINQAAEQFAERQAEIEKEKQKALDMGKMPEEVEKKAKEDLNKANEDYGKKLQQDYDDLVKMTKGLNMVSDEMKPFADYLAYLKKKIVDAMGGGDKSKFNEKQINLITTAFNGLTSALQESGNAALEFASIITNSLSSAFKDGNFDISAFSSGMQGGFIAMWFSAVLDAFKDKPEPVRYQEEKYDVFKALQERAKQDSRLKQLEEMWDYYNNMSKIARDIFGESVLKDIRELEDEIKKAIDEWAKAIGTSINDIASKIEDAFQASNAYEFLQNWNQSLYEMTRTALIRGFMAQEAYQALYKGLSDTIALAVLDGQLSAQELLDIRTQGNALGSQLSVLYQALNILESTFPGANQGSSSNETSYTAGSNQAITYNIYATIEAGIFWGDRDKALEAAIEIGNLIAEETGRA